MKSILLESGRRYLARMLAARQKIIIGEARVGSAAAFDPASDVNATEVLPAPPVFIAGPRAIIPSVVNQDTARFTVVLYEHQGPFHVGNVMLFAHEIVRQQIRKIPLAWAVADFSTPKLPTQPGKIGSRMLLTLSFEFFNVADAIELTVVPPQYSSLASYPDELEMPTPGNLVYQQGYLQNMTTMYRPVMYARRSQDDRVFGFPFMQRIDDPFFGWLNGGIATDGYIPWNGDYLWGYYFATPEEHFINVVDGGADWDDNFFDFHDGDVF